MNRKSLLKGLLLVSQIAFSMLAPIGLMILVGYFLVEWLEQSWIVLVCALVGIVVGYRNVWQLVRSYTKEDRPAERTVRRKRHVDPVEEEFQKWKAERQREETADEK